MTVSIFRRRSLAAQVAALFANGEQGLWYDVSDIRTMFQDSAGTTPVYMPGQGQIDPPVGRILDKSGRGNHASQSTATSRPTLSARYNLLVSTGMLSTQSVSVAPTTYTLRFAGAGTVTLSGAAMGVYSAGVYTITCSAGTLVFTTAGAVNDADFRSTTDGVGLPVYQRVVDASTYDIVGFPLYLRFDGVDDWFQSPASVDLSAKDKVVVFAAARKLSDSATGMLVEFSNSVNSNPGTFYLTAPETTGAGGDFKFRSRGSLAATAAPAAQSLAPVTAIAIGVADIAVPTKKILLNGVERQSNSEAQGAGNFGNYTLYVGRRAGTGLSFNGRLYGLIVVGMPMLDAKIAMVSRYLNSKAKAY